MQFIKAGEPADSNIFNKLDERKRRLLASGRDVINLSIGTPDFQPDRHVMEAVSRAALDPEQYKYSLTETRALLDAVQDWYSRRYGVQLADEEIMAVCGSQEGIAHVGFAFAGPNDLILAPDPGYPIFSFGPLMTGATVGLYPLRAENNWQLDFADIPEEVASRAKAIVVSYPNNPTASVADRSFLRGSWPMRASIKSSSCTITPIPTCSSTGNRGCHSCPYRAQKKSGSNLIPFPRRIT